MSTPTTTNAQNDEQRLNNLAKGLTSHGDPTGVYVDPAKFEQQKQDLKVGFIGIVILVIIAVIFLVWKFTGKNRKSKTPSNGSI